MALSMLISLYTVREVLYVLGVIDYGIFNVVGGIVIMFSFFGNTMATAAQRFFAYEIGKGNVYELKRVFSVTIAIYIFIIVVIFLLAESIGVWFLNSKMIIPVNRISAANWVYQFSVLSFVVTVYSVPYNALIIAYENMRAYAYISIFESLLRFVAVYSLTVFQYDKLKLYAVFLFFVNLFVMIAYVYICSNKYKECGFRLCYDKKLYKKILNYSAWNLFGAVAAIFNNQGVNIILNIFFGPAINAARGIAFQVSSTVSQFVINFHTAVKAQIIILYAKGRISDMMLLVFNSSKYSYFLLLIVSAPVLVETEYILKILLKNIPSDLVLFTRLVILNALVDSLTHSLQTAAQATGNIKIYQTVIGSVLLLNLPISYIMLLMGMHAEVTMYVSIFLSIVSVLLRLVLLKRILDISIWRYIKGVIVSVLQVSIIIFIILVTMSNYILCNYDKFFVVIFMTFVAPIVVYNYGLKRNERIYLKDMLRNKIHNLSKSS